MRPSERRRGDRRRASTNSELLDRRRELPELRGQVKDDKCRFCTKARFGAAPSAGCWWMMQRGVAAPTATIRLAGRLSRPAAARRARAQAPPRRAFLALG